MTQITKKFKQFNDDDFSEYKVISPKLEQVYKHFKIQDPESQYNFLISWLVPELDVSITEAIYGKRPKDRLELMEKEADTYNQNTNGATFHIPLLEFYRKHNAEVNADRPTPNGIITRIVLLAPRLYIPELYEKSPQFIRNMIHRQIYKCNLSKRENLQKLLNLEKTIMTLYEKEMLKFETPENFLKRNSFPTMSRDFLESDIKTKTFIY